MKKMTCVVAVSTKFFCCQNQWYTMLCLWGFIQVSPGDNRTGWLGVQHLQLTHLTFLFCSISTRACNLNQSMPWWVSCKKSSTFWWCCCCCYDCCWQSIILNAYPYCGSETVYSTQNCQRLSPDISLVADPLFEGYLPPVRAITLLLLLLLHSRSY